MFSQIGRWRWGVTQQYLAGELSVLLSRLQAVTPSQFSVADVARLRREAETLPVPALTGVAQRALKLADCLCWDSLEHGDPESFRRLAVVEADLHEFGVCAGMLSDDRGQSAHADSPE